MTRAARRLATAASLAIAVALPARAADTPAPPKPAAAAAAAPANTVPAADPLAAAREKIAAKDFPAALDALMPVRGGDRADWHNLMGYVMRNMPAADFDVAEYHYGQALRINPAHRGALEYLGALYLQTGRRAKAEAQLAALAKACPAGCPELADLQDALAKAKP